MLLITRSLILFVFVLLCLASCNDEYVVDCYNAFDLPPAEMLEQNEYVFVGTVETVNTIASLGEVDVVGLTIAYYLTEYAICPLQTVQSPTKDSIIFFWYITGVNHSGRHWRSGLPVAGLSFELIAGNRINAPDDNIKVLSTEVSDSISVFLDVSAGVRSSEDLSIISDGNLILAQRLKANEYLSGRLRECQASGPVIHGTEFSCQTMESFRDTWIYYCDSTVTDNIARKLTAGEYLQELLHLAGKREEPIEMPMRIWEVPAGWKLERE